MDTTAKILITFTLLATVSMPARSGCKKFHLSGVWQDFTQGQNSNTIGECLFNIDKNGVISKTSACNSYASATYLPTNNITNGTLEINSNCEISGKIVGKKGANTVFVKGQMDISKNSFTAITRNNSGVIVLHHFVKK